MHAVGARRTKIGERGGRRRGRARAQCGPLHKGSGRDRDAARTRTAAGELPRWVRTGGEGRRRGLVAAQAQRGAGPRRRAGARRAAPRPRPPGVQSGLQGAPPARQRFLPSISPAERGGGAAAAGPPRVSRGGEHAGDAARGASPGVAGGARREGCGEWSTGCKNLTSPVAPHGGRWTPPTKYHRAVCHFPLRPALGRQACPSEAYLS